MGVSTKAGLSAAILVVSDRASRSEYADRTGPALAVFLMERGWRVVAVQVTPDDEGAIAQILKAWCDAGLAGLVLTAGGTGLGPRDVTPEATRMVIEKELPGLSELMRSRGSIKTPRAALSRAVSGSRAGSLIVNLPGSPAGSVESLECVLDLIPHALEMLRGGGHGEPQGHDGEEGHHDHP